MEDMSSINSEVGGTIRTYRELSKLTQNDLSEATGFSRSKIIEIERGWGWRDTKNGRMKTPVTPIPEDLLKIAPIIGVNPSALLEEAGYNSKDYSTATALTRADLIDLTPEEMHIIRAVLKALREARHAPPTH